MWNISGTVYLYYKKSPNPPIVQQWKCRTGVLMRNKKTTKNKAKGVKWAQHMETWEEIQSSLPFPCSWVVIMPFVSEITL